MVEVFHWRDFSQARGNMHTFDALSQIMQGQVNAVLESIAARSELHAQGLQLVKVAEVQGDDLDRAFMLTNHIDSDWTENEGVQVVAEQESGQENGKKRSHGVRSTSVGDLMRKDGACFMVSAIGFSELPADINLDTPVASNQQHKKPSF